MSDAPWLVVVDMQEGFRTGPWATPGFDALVPRVRALVDEHDDRVVFTRFVPLASPQGAWVSYYDEWPFALETPASTWDVVDGLDAAGRPTVDAPTFGKWGPALLAATGGSRDVVVCGVSTDCCVLSTVLAAVDDGARAGVVAEACAGVDEASHAAALHVMSLYAPAVRLL
ncbi:cysteine hydrolase family protein [Solicola sp. PLA-1-18]|uniref:cysteine hydrolase family protein n=1 Tax=Solicola sp. PLA-1-18 TaxID=3380532 RepID=UPI003B76C939